MQRRRMRTAVLLGLALLVCAISAAPVRAAAGLSAFSMARAQANGNQQNLVVDTGTGYAFAYADSGLGPYAKAKADAAAGALGAIAYNGTMDGWGGYFGEAEVNDYFTLDGLPAGTPVILGAQVWLKGQLTAGSGTCCNSKADVSAQLIPFGPIALDPPPNFNDAVTNDFLPASGRFSVEQKSVNQLLTMRIQVVAGEPFEFGYRLVAHVDGIGSSDFYGTALLGFTLPSGTSIQSVAGFAQAAAVPEPESWAMLLAGLGLLGVRLRGIASKDSRETSR